MGVVGGSRHYVGGGLGVESGWKCPACGAENAGAIAQGCSHCGSGQPGVHGEPPPSRGARGGRATPPPPEPEARQDDVATWWAEQHPDASVEEAYRAGYEAGVQAVRAAARPVAPGAQGNEKIARTIIAALDYFADHVLRQAPQEVATGEWCSVDEVHALIEQLAQTGGVHA